jgi:hypothetical protein
MRIVQPVARIFFVTCPASQNKETDVLAILLPLDLAPHQACIMRARDIRTPFFSWPLLSHGFAMHELNSVNGVITIVQEHRFQLRQDDGEHRLFILAHDVPQQ